MNPAQHQQAIELCDQLAGRIEAVRRKEHDPFLPDISWDIKGSYMMVGAFIGVTVMGLCGMIMRLCGYI